MSIKCCYGCVAQKRYPGCGATCPEYLEEKAKDAREKEAYRKERAIANGIYCSRTRKVEEAYRKRRNKKK